MYNILKIECRKSNWVLSFSSSKRATRVLDKGCFLSDLTGGQLEKCHVHANSTTHTHTHTYTPNKLNPSSLPTPIFNKFYQKSHR